MPQITKEILHHRFLRMVSRSLRSRLLLRSVLLGMGVVLFGCVNQPDVPPPIPPASSVASYFMPRSTAIRYKYSHLDYRGAGYSDSSYLFAYNGFSSSATTADGLSGIDEYWSSDLNQNSKHLLESFVSDSLVVVYGPNSQSSDNRLVLLKRGLKDSATWIAASQFLTPDGRVVQIKATVLNHVDQLIVGNTKYTNVYPVSYDVSGPLSADPLSEYQSGGRHVIYFAENAGKILEASYGPQARKLWVDQLDTVTQR